MSRAGAQKKRQDAADLERQVEAGFTDKIPLKPEVVVACEEGMKERRLEICFALCHNKTRGPVLPDGDFVGAWIANNVIDQIMAHFAERQSKILIPKPGMMVPR